MSNEYGPNKTEFQGQWFLWLAVGVGLGLAIGAMRWA